jgi:hypothetical protein
MRKSLVFVVIYFSLSCSSFLTQKARRISKLFHTGYHDSHDHEGDSCVVRKYFLSTKVEELLDLSGPIFASKWKKQTLTHLQINITTSCVRKAQVTRHVSDTRRLISTHKIFYLETFRVIFCHIYIKSQIVSNPVSLA